MARRLLRCGDVRLALLALTIAAPAIAAPCATTDTDPTLPSCTPRAFARLAARRHDLHASHALDVSLAAGVIATAGDDGALATTSARADATYTLGIGRDIETYAFAIGAGVTARRTDGTVDGFGGATRLSLELGPTAPPADARYAERAALAPFPLSFELAHDGDLAALPGLAQPADVARGPYSREHLEARTRALRIAIIDAKPDQPIRPWDFDLFPVSGELDATVQQGTRVGWTGGGAFLGLTLAGSHDVRCDVLAFDVHAVDLPDGTAREWSEVWPLRVVAHSPVTGTDFRIGWGMLDGPLWGSHQNVGAIAVGDFATASAGYARTPYLTMAGIPALEDRLYGELVVGGDFHVVARAFVARTEQIVGASIARVDWTGGLEGDGAHRVGPVDVGLRAEVGRSFYASLDDAAPAPGFGARAAITVSRAISRRYTR